MNTPSPINHLPPATYVDPNSLNQSQKIHGFQDEIDHFLTDLSDDQQVFAAEDLSPTDQTTLKQLESALANHHYDVAEQLAKTLIRELNRTNNAKAIGHVLHLFSSIQSHSPTLSSIYQRLQTVANMLSPPS